MYSTVTAYLQANSANWTGIPAFVASSATLTNKISELSEMLYHPDSNTSGIVNLKRRKQQEASELCVEIAAALYSYAVRTENDALKAEVRITRSRLLNTNKLNFLILLDGVIDHTTEVLNELSDYGVDQVRLDALIASRNVVADLLYLPRQKQVQSRLFNAMLVERFREIDRILREEIDMLVATFRSSDPEFYLGYTNARLVVDYGTRHQGSETEGNTQNEADGSGE